MPSIKHSYLCLNRNKGFSFSPLPPSPALTPFPSLSLPQSIADPKAETFFTVFCFKENAEKKEYLWGNIVDNSCPYTLDVHLPGGSFSLSSSFCCFLASYFLREFYIQKCVSKFDENNNISFDFRFLIWNV